MYIEEVDQALVEIKDSHTNNRIKSLLTQSLVILICGQFEQKIKHILTDRCKSVSDVTIKNFVNDHIHKSALRSLRVSELSGLLGRFHPSYKEKFNQKIKENGQVKTTYESILTNRNSVAHGASITATFDEIRMYYEKAHMILDYFEQSLIMSN
ncbi:MAG: MAE_28990/MAE_18760 family HEPN-like nuclease [Bacteroidetes bacterium]|nr:MAE_28990/MAE_18760 family HEPN-like nuclease [Bacteroidota bacterium]